MRLYTIISRANKMQKSKQIRRYFKSFTSKSYRINPAKPKARFVKQKFKI